MTGIDWTDTDWVQHLGTERLTLLRDALEQHDSLLAQGMAEECVVELRARAAATQAKLAGAAWRQPWWPLTELERATFGGQS